MKFFAIFGDLILRMFNFVGSLILEIPNIPNRIRGIKTDNFKDRMDSEVIKENISKIKNSSMIQENISKISKVNATQTYQNIKRDEYTESISDKAKIERGFGKFTSDEKERTVFILQIISGAFLVFSMLYIFNFFSFIIYGLLGVASVAYILYVLFTKIKFMYEADFNAYRDFFLMYVAVGIILVLVGSNPNFVMSFSFQFFPSLSVLLFAVIAAIAVFLIFRIRYHRDFTYGKVIETGKKTAHVKVEYDICSNVKPDIYIVDNKYGAHDGDMVKLQIEENILSMKGNKPIIISEILN
ncbi:MAG: DUF2101 family protein [Methanobacterium sp.]